MSENLILMLNGFLVGIFVGAGITVLFVLLGRKKYSGHVSEWGPTLSCGIFDHSAIRQLAHKLRDCGFDSDFEGWLGPIWMRVSYDTLQVSKHSPARIKRDRKFFGAESRLLGFEHARLKGSGDE